MKRRSAGLASALALYACSALAQPPDTILFNGRIVTLDAASSVHQALAIRDGRIAALGTNAQIKKLVGRESCGQGSIVDLKGRTIPGLIDSHMHTIRAALSFATDVNWIGAEALARLRDAAKTRKPGDWLIVAGGWTPEQVAEKRAPIQAELIEAGGEHPVYVQRSGGAHRRRVEHSNVPAAGRSRGRLSWESGASH